MFNAPLLGWRRAEVTERRTREDWARQIKKLVDEDFPNAKKITLVMDNLNTHNPASLYETFQPEEAKRIRDRLEIHYTPRHGSWLNMAEIEFSVLNNHGLSDRIPAIEQMRREVSAWNKIRNKKSSTINWRFTTADARIKLARLYPLFEP
jgi:transposase